jgi:hypothetical protein
MATQYKLNDEYAEHLICTMDLTTAALNEFLQAAGQERTFSFGSSLHFSGRIDSQRLGNQASGIKHQNSFAMKIRIST